MIWIKRITTRGMLREVRPDFCREAANHTDERNLSAAGERGLNACFAKAKCIADN
jgi:hypothetical protein